jgi:hypothetical protein
LIGNPLLIAGNKPLTFGSVDMPQQETTCHRCGKSGQLSFGEGGTGWWESFRCASCDYAYEADGRPPTPAKFRQVILREQGQWSLDAPSMPTVELLKVLRGVLSLSLKELQQLRSRLPGQICEGTRFEMTRLLREIQNRVPLCGIVVGSRGGPMPIDITDGTDITDSSE